jgi:hypothetical protein
MISFRRPAHTNIPYQPVTTYSFTRFVFRDPINKKYLLWALSVTVIQLVIFKICYPFADYIVDSYTYIDAAATKALVGYRPMGYSQLLRALHHITRSDTALVVLQFLLVQAGWLFLFFTVRYFFPLRKVISNTLFILVLTNPLLIYLSNYVSSDALFIAFSLLWFTQLLWIVNRPHWLHLFTQALLLFVLFKLRYTALYLPAVSILAFIMSRQRWWYQLTGITLSVLPIFLAVKHIERLTKQETGTAVFSAFSGWSTANNALHMYPYITVKDADFTSPACRELNQVVQQYFDTVPASQLPYPYVKVTYLWGDKRTPLKYYMLQQQLKKKINGYFSAWNAVAPVFSEYGNTLIKQHPLAYARYFMWPNAKTYIVPVIESFATYNASLDTVDQTAADWFRYKSTHVRSVPYSWQRFLIYPVSYYFTLLNVAFVVLVLLLLRRYKTYVRTLPAPLLLSVALVICCWGIYFLFSTFAAPIVLRYQVFPMIQYTFFCGVMLHLVLDSNKKSTQTV